MVYIVYIGAEWCVTCKVIKPKMEELAKKFSISYKIYDLEELDEEDAESITKVPTIRIYDGETKIQEYNVKQVESLENWLQQNISLTTDDF